MVPILRICVKNVLVQFRKWYFILRPRKCKNMNVGDTPVLPFCAPGTSNFEKCRYRFLGICMKNVLEQFRRRYLISRSRKYQKHECHSYPIFTLEKENFANPFLSIPLHTHTDISSKFHVSNFNSQDILFYIYNTPILPLCAPGTSNFGKCRNRILGICIF